MAERIWLFSFIILTAFSKLSETQINFGEAPIIERPDKPTGGPSNSGGFSFAGPSDDTPDGIPSGAGDDSSFSFAGGKETFPEIELAYDYDDDDEPEEPGVIEARKRNDCVTFQNRKGRCKPLSRCNPLKGLFDGGARFNIDVNKIIRQSICGFQGFLPKVCCPRRRSGGKRPRPKPSKPKPSPKPRPTIRTTTTTTTTRRPTTPKVSPTTPRDNGGITLLPPSSGSTSVKEFTGEGLPRTCGFSEAKHNRIVGGSVAEEGAWPWVAALGYQDGQGNLDFLCGGALVHPQYVATASHCVYGRRDLVAVRLGDHDLLSDDDGVEPITVPIAEKFLHPQYNPSTYENDIALLRLSRPVPIRAGIHPICLPNTEELINEKFEGRSPFVVGWGAVRFNGPTSATLREVQVPVVPDADCQDKFKSFSSVKVDDKSICAGFKDGGKDACQGDSGGPLMMPLRRGTRWVLIGIVSFGYRCAEPGYPGVYSRVTSHLNWMQEIMR